MKMISGTTTNPNQLTKNADKIVNIPDIAAEIPGMTIRIAAIVINRIAMGMAAITNGIQPIIGHSIKSERGIYHAPINAPIIINIIGIAMVAQINHRQLNNRNGIENGNSGIDTIAVKMKVIIPKTAITNPIQINHSEKRSSTIWNIHTPGHGRMHISMNEIAAQITKTT